MPKLTSSPPKAMDSTAYSKKPKATKEKAFRVSTATVMYLTPGQFKFIRGRLQEYKLHKRSADARLEFLRDLWVQFLDVYPEQNIPPFPEDADLVERFHLSRARALGYRLDNMLDFAAGIQHSTRKA